MSNQADFRNRSLINKLVPVNLIVLANRPRMLCQMLWRAIGNTPDLKVVAEIRDLARLPDQVRWASIHWLVVNLTAEDRIPGWARILQRRHPLLSVLAVSIDGSRVKIRVPIEGMIHSFRTFALHNVSLIKLLSLLRQRVGATMRNLDAGHGYDG